jgi:hypothetical protein
VGKFVLGVAAAALALSACAEAQLTEPAKDMSKQEEAPELALPRAMNGLELKTGANDQTWGLGNAAWNVDLDRGIIEFRNAKGWLISAPVQVIGTYDTRDGTFMWGWDHPSVPLHSANAAKSVHDYGKRHGLAKMTTRLVKISEQEAWQFTALADYLSSGIGAYRGPVGTTLVFMTFGEVTISKD